MTNQLTSREWWRAALIRALRTALVITVPYFGGASLGAIPWLTLASAVGLAFVASFVTSLGGLVETTGQVSWWYAILERVVKTFAQALAVGLGQAVLFTDVDWAVALQAAAIAAIGSLLLGFLTKLPEATLLPSPVTPVAQVDNSDVVPVSGGSTIDFPSAIVTPPGPPPASQ